MKKNKENKVTKEQVDRIINKIRSEGKKREKGYEEKYNPLINRLKERVEEGKRLRKESMPKYREKINIYNLDKRFIDVRYNLQRKIDKKKFERGKEIINKLSMSDNKKR